MPSRPDIPRRVIYILPDPEDGSMRIFMDCFGPENGGGGVVITIFPTTSSNISKSMLTIYL
jgi:hypothetical protein